MRSNRVRMRTAFAREPRWHANRVRMRTRCETRSHANAHMRTANALRMRTRFVRERGSQRFRTRT
eukprot:7181878-Lingulodinium_polyedra.AAC.1